MGCAACADYIVNSQGSSKVSDMWLGPSREAQGHAPHVLTKAGSGTQVGGLVLQKRCHELAALGYVDADFLDIIMRVGDAVSFATAPYVSSAADCSLLPKSSPPSFARFTRKTSSAMPSDR